MPYPIDVFTNKIICRDCRLLLPHIPQESIDLIVTDPPYGVSYRSRDGRTFLNDDNTLWIQPVFTELYRVLKPDSFCITFCGFTNTDVFLSAWKAAGFRPLDVLVWAKQYPSSERFIGRYHEQAYLLAKGRPDKPHLRLPSVSEEWRYTGNKLHPTQKPVMAITPLILAFSKPNGLVLDPFAGSATTAVAARLCGRRFIMIEQDRRYYQIAKQRLRRSVQSSAAIL